jgi:hypothetical protein
MLGSRGATVRWEDSILFFFKGGSLLFQPLLVALILLMLVDDVASCYNFEATEENHVGRCGKVTRVVSWLFWS